MSGQPGRTSLVLAAVALVWVGCSSSAPPKGIVPAVPLLTQVEQLSGEYCYVGPDFNIRSYRREPAAIPFVDVAALGRPTKVSVTASPQEVIFRYTDTDGAAREETFLPANFRAVWRDGAFEMEGEGGSGLEGSSGGIYVYGSSRESRLFKLADGRLVMTDSVRTKGYSEEEGHANPVFHAYEATVAVILDPVADGCEAGAVSRAPQPWFGSGADLRDPACAAELEEQTKAVLVDQGEDPEVAAGCSKDAIGTLRAGPGSREFFISTPGAAYGFDIARKDPGCVLRLYYRRRPHSQVTDNIFYLAKRPLPGCVCNP
jgi:hypothetical protein